MEALGLQRAPAKRRGNIGKGLSFWALKSAALSSYFSSITFSYEILYKTLNPLVSSFITW